jgi:hypothetical protein
VARFAVVTVVLPCAPAYAASGRTDVVSDDATPTSDEDDDWTVGAEIDTVSRFIWRGMAFSHGPVVQPSAWGSLYHFNASLWTNFLLTDATSNPLSAVVPSVSYTFKWKKLTIEPGVIYYDYYSAVGGSGPAAHERTAEASVEAALKFGAFSILSDHYVDIVTNPGAYFGTIGGEFEPSFGKWTFGVKADVGWATADFNSAYFGTSTAALNVAEGTASVRYEITNIAYAVVHADANTLLSPSLYAGGGPASLAVVGATFGVEL